MTTNENVPVARQNQIVVLLITSKVNDTMFITIHLPGSIIDNHGKHLLNIKAFPE